MNRAALAAFHSEFPGVNPEEGGTKKPRANWDQRRARLINQSTALVTAQDKAGLRPPRLRRGKALPGPAQCGAFGRKAGKGLASKTPAPRRARGQSRR